jgi:hypothetical protein
MKNSLKLSLIGVAAAVVLVGCDDAGVVTDSTPSAAEQACLRDVTRTTNNPDVVLLGSSFSQAGTEVIVGVGEQRARWRCIAYSDGTTGGITSLTDEGRL